MRTSKVGASTGRCCITFVAMLLLACGVFPQSTTDGAIGGAVTDGSGAVIPNAIIATHNLGTGATSNGTTDDVGRYLITHLQPGTYSMEISASGFSASLVPAFSLPSRMAVRIAS